MYLFLPTLLEAGRRSPPRVPSSKLAKVIENC